MTTYWALSDDSPQDTGDELGLGFCGIFTTPERAIDHLRYVVLGDKVDNFWWYGYKSGGYTGYWYDPDGQREYYYHIVSCTPDGQWPGNRPEIYPAEAMLSSLPEMHDTEFPPDADGT